MAHRRISHLSEDASEGGERTARSNGRSRSPIVPFPIRTACPLLMEGSPSAQRAAPLVRAANETGLSIPPQVQAKKAGDTLLPPLPIEQVFRVSSRQLSGPERVFVRVCFFFRPPLSCRTVDWSAQKNAETSLTCTLYQDRIVSNIIIFLFFTFILSEDIHGLFGLFGAPCRGRQAADG